MTERKYTFPKCNAWDVSALLSMKLNSAVQPGGDTMIEFLDALHYHIVQILHEAHKMAGIVPYKTIPHSTPDALWMWIIAMKTQYTLEGVHCHVCVQRSPEGGRFGVFATKPLQVDTYVTTFPVDAILLHEHGMSVLTDDNQPTDWPMDDVSNMMATDSKHVSVAASPLYFCPERCGHMIFRDKQRANVIVSTLFGGAMNLVRVVCPVAHGEELFKT